MTTAAFLARCASILFVAAAITTCNRSEADRDEIVGPWFVENAGERGLDFLHVRASEQRFWFPEIMGGGVGLLDFDDDGDLDVYLVQSGDLAGGDDDLGRNKLFANRGDGTFVDVTAGSGADDPGYGMGCTCGDYDGDGDTDIYVTNVGPNVLLRNDGNGRFTDVTSDAGVGHPGWSTSSAFFDANGDGDLDLFVVNYLHWSLNVEMECLSPQGEDYCSPNSYASPAADAFYENQGDGVFVDASERAGINSAFGNGLGTSVGDFDGDGWIDVYVANDMMPNQLWINRGDGTFTDDALIAGCAANMNGESEAGMGTVAFDLENDGDLDLFMTHLRQETNTLYINENGVFTDRTAPLGLAAPSLRFTGFGLAVADFDHDGRLDFFIANGSVTKNRPELEPGAPYAEPDLLFRGGADRFHEVFPRGGVELPTVRASRGAAAGDLDGDGDIDVVVVDSGETVRFLENIAASGSWLRLDVRGTSGAPALGALVRVEPANGGSPEDVQWRHVAPAVSYCSSSDPRVHFGLGDGNVRSRVDVTWPDGREESFGPLAPNEEHLLRRGAGRPLR